MDLKYIHILIPRTCEVEFVDVILLKILREGDYHGLSPWAQSNYEDLYRKEAEGSESEKEM